MDRMDDSENNILDGVLSLPASPVQSGDTRNELNNLECDEERKDAGSDGGANEGPAGNSSVARNDAKVVPAEVSNFNTANIVQKSISVMLRVLECSSGEWSDASLSTDLSDAVQELQSYLSAVNLLVECEDEESATAVPPAGSVLAGGRRKQPVPTKKSTTAVSRELSDEEEIPALRPRVQRSSGRTSAKKKSTTAVSRVASNEEEMPAPRPRAPRSSRKSATSSKKNKPSSSNERPSPTPSSDSEFVFRLEESSYVMFGKIVNEELRELIQLSADIEKVGLFYDGGEKWSKQPETFRKDGRVTPPAYKEHAAAEVTRFSANRVENTIRIGHGKKSFEALHVGHGVFLRLDDHKDFLGEVEQLIKNYPKEAFSQSAMKRPGPVPDARKNIHRRIEASFWPGDSCRVISDPLSAHTNRPPFHQIRVKVAMRK